jgi:hypothetical protein
LELEVIALTSTLSILLFFLFSSFYFLFLPPTPNPLPSGKRALRFASPCFYPPPLLQLSSYWAADVNPLVLAPHLCCLYFWIPRFRGEWRKESTRLCHPRWKAGVHSYSSFYLPFIWVSLFKDRGVAMGKPHCNSSIWTFRSCTYRWLLLPTLNDLFSFRV